MWQIKHKLESGIQETLIQRWNWIKRLWQMNFLLCPECYPSVIIVTLQQWEGTVLQLHDNAIQDRQHWWNVQKEQDEGLVVGPGWRAEVKEKRRVSPKNIKLKLSPVKVKGNPFSIELNATFLCFWNHTTKWTLYVKSPRYCYKLYYIFLWETMNYLF